MPDLYTLPLLAVLAMLALAGSVIAFQFITGVPPMPSSAAQIAGVVSMLRRARCPADGVIYDLGSGWGSLLISLARAFPQAQVRGFEMSPLPYLVSRWRTRGLKNVRISRCDFFQCRLDDADAVTCYLMIAPMRKLANHLDRTLRKGARVVSVTFGFRDRKPAAVARGGDVMLYVWHTDGTRMPARATHD
jgi:cyclopropane fatty-acyl-phospholipid synthase-like methyltransferase